MHFWYRQITLPELHHFPGGSVAAYFGLRKVRIDRVTKADVSVKKNAYRGLGVHQDIPAFAYQALGMLVAGTVMTILLYDALSDAHLDLGSGFQSFYAWYNLLIAIASIIIQTLSARIIEQLTLKNSFLIQPFVMLVSSVLNFLCGLPEQRRCAGRGAASYDTIDLSNRKAFQALVPNEKRGRVSMFIDSYLPSFGTILGSLITFGIIAAGLGLGWKRDLYGAVYLGLGVVLAVLAVWAAFRVRKTYEASLLNWQLKRRTRGSSGVLDNLDF